MVKIFLDGADKETILNHATHPLVQGFTTNPSLLKKAGVTDYESFAKSLLEVKKPISFEVFADEEKEIERQARIISSWGENVYVKIPITTTNGTPNNQLIHKLRKEGVKVNVTAITYNEQIDFEYAEAPMIVSVFAGRIADTGRDPAFQMMNAKDKINFGNVELLWASPREVLNIYQADRIGVDIITVSPELLKKYEEYKNKDLKRVSLETIQMFYDDAQGLSL